MMGLSADLTLGRPCNGVSHGVAFGGSNIDHMLKLEYYLKALEDERKKIEAFKRELPFCMQLLNDEIEASKEQLSDYQEPPMKPQSTLTSIGEGDQGVKGGDLRPILEEFIPMRKLSEDVNEDNKGTSGSSCTKGAKPINGVVTQTKFWSPAEAYTHGQEMVSSMIDKPYKKRDIMRMGGQADGEIPKPVLNSQKGGAFVPFCGSKRQMSAEHLVEGNREGSPPTPRHDVARSLTHVSGCEGEACHHQHVKESQNSMATTSMPSHSNGAGLQAAQRKPRRCWSPELHKRFVNALQQLGGSEVATPKQIRELMKVDGLTNDEVKSHLQKYRLHTRRPNPSFHTATAHAAQLVLLGSIWVPPEYAAQGAASGSQALPQAQVESMVERQATHLQATPSCSEDRYIQLKSTPASMPLQLHPALYALHRDTACGTAVATTQSHGSSQGPLHHLSAAHSPDAGREDENLGEDAGRNEGSSCKDENRASMHVDYDNGHHAAYVERRGPLHVQHKWMSNSGAISAHEILSGGEDDSEAEDGRVYETPI